LTGHSAILADEINQLVDRLDELSSELIRSGQTAQLHLQTAETLAALRALGRVVLRFDQEVEIPSLTPEQSDQLTTAVHTFEKDLR
jgi:nitrogen-specific signal transduction histidine kinase